MADQLAARRAAHFSALLKSGKYSDLTITCGARHWRVHKNILCPQSDFFKKTCDGIFKEAKESIIDLSAENQHAIAALIRFMYCGDYDAARILPPDLESDAMLLHVRVVGLAQVYFVEPLQEHASTLAVGLLKSWDGVSPGFVEAVHEIYTGTHDVSVGTTLRKAAVSAAMVNGVALFGPTGESNFNTREILLEGTPDFMEDWARGMSFCNSTLASAKTDLEAVNSELKGDNGTLSERHIRFQDAYDRYKVNIDELKTDGRTLDANNKDLTTVTENFTTAFDDLTAEFNDQERLMRYRQLPDKPGKYKMDEDSGPAPDLYRCPNCQVMFFEDFKESETCHHACFKYGWCGKNGRFLLVLSYTEWQTHLVRKT